MEPRVDDKDDLLGYGLLQSDFWEDPRVQQHHRQASQLKQQVWLHSSWDNDTEEATDWDAQADHELDQEQGHINDGPWDLDSEGGAV